MTGTALTRQEKILAVIDQPERFKALLPTDVDLAKFTAVIKRGLQQNPDLLSKDTASLILACQQAAQDGLLPDGREGALVAYGNKVQWQPMIGGLRKRMAQHGFDIRADVVHENDSFDYSLGDDPRITHKAPQLGQPRGEVIGAYAIATDDKGNKYREIMDRAQLDAVAAVSRSGTGGPWKGPFRTEMYRKTVAKRLIKSLPLHDDRLAELIQRDNEQYDLGAKPTAPSETAVKVQEALRPQTAAEPETAATDAVEDAEFVDTKTGEVTSNDDDAPF